MIRTAGIMLLAGSFLAVPAGAQEVGTKADWMNNYMEFVVTSPGQAGDTDAQGLVKAVLHGRMVAYGQMLARAEGVAVMGVGTVDALKVRDFGTFGAGKSGLPLPGITLKSIRKVPVRRGPPLYELVYRTPLAGEGSLLNSVWDGLRRQVVADPPDQFKGPVGVPASSGTFDSGKRYTGLVVDLRGLRAQASPVVRVISESNGREVYGVMKATSEYVRKQGMVGYARSVTAPPSIRDRIGDTPLVVSAVRMEGCNPVVSEQDAARIAYADQLAHFLPRCRVAFLIGER